MIRSWNAQVDEVFPLKMLVFRSPLTSGGLLEVQLVGREARSVVHNGHERPLFIGEVL
jgi:hypothetical protein